MTWALPHKLFVSPGRFELLWPAHVKERRQPAIWRTRYDHHWFLPFKVPHHSPASTSSPLALTHVSHQLSYILWCLVFVCSFIPGYYKPHSNVERESSVACPLWVVCMSVCMFECCGVPVCLYVLEEYHVLLHTHKDVQTYRSQTQ